MEFNHKVSTWSVIIFILVSKMDYFTGNMIPEKTVELDLHVSTGYKILWYESKYSENLLAYYWDQIGFIWQRVWK